MRAIALFGLAVSAGAQLLPSQTLDGYTLDDYLVGTQPCESENGKKTPSPRECGIYGHITPVVPSLILELTAEQAQANGAPSGCVFDANNEGAPLFSVSQAASGVPDQSADWRHVCIRTSVVTAAPTPTAAPPTAASPTAAPPTAASPTAAPPTAASPTAAPPTAAPPAAPPTAPTAAPPTAAATCKGKTCQAVFLEHCAAPYGSNNPGGVPARSPKETLLAQCPLCSGATGIDACPARLYSDAEGPTAAWHLAVGGMAPASVCASMGALAGLLALVRTVRARASRPVVDARELEEINRCPEIGE